MRCFAIIGLAPLVFVLTAGTALAQSSPQTQPPDPVEQATLHLGPLGLNPAIVIHDVGPDNNVFNDPTNPKSDFTATITPRLEVLTHPGPLKISWTTTTDYVYYQTYASERGTNFGNTLRFDFDFGAFQPFVSAGYGNTRDRFNREIDARARHRDAQYGAGIRIQLFEALFATAGVRQSKTDYEQSAEFRGQNLATTLDRTNDAIDAGAGTAITPLTSLAVNVTRERERFLYSPERNSQTLRIMPTVTFSPLAVLSGTASFGYRRFTTGSSQVPDYHGFISTVTLSSTVRERHRLEGTFARDLQYSYEQDVAEYIETGLTLAWNWQVAGPIDSRIYGGRSRLHYRSPALSDGKTDDIAHDYGFSVGWRLKEYLRAGVNGDWRGRDSERSVDRTYDNRRIYATLTWGKVS